MPYFGFRYGMDIYYILLVVPAFLLSIVAQIRVNSVYRKMSGRMNSSGLTGAAAAAAVLHHYGIYDVQIQRVNGRLTDHFDPRAKVIRLSDGVYNSCSVAAVGIAAHEAGHAAQHAEGYLPIKIRNAIIPVCNIGSFLGIPLALIGFYMSFEPLITIGLALYSLIMIFQLVTLPVELNASRRALSVIENDGLLRTDEEYKSAKKVLTAAAMTYVAALASAIANLLRLVLLFGRNRRD